MSKVSQVKGVKPSSKKASPSVSISSELAGINFERYSHHLRSSWIVTCRNWLDNNRYISMFVNPSEVQWNMPRREQMTKTAAGVVRNTWRNRYRNTYFDEPTLNITFQSGNIMPSAGLPDSVLYDREKYENFKDYPSPPPGLTNFYDFMNLLDQPMLYGNVENYHILMYRSRIFPRIRLEGYFIGTSPLAFTDSAANGNSFTWTSTFQVYRSYPSLTKKYLLGAEWSNWAKTNALDEMIPKGYHSPLTQEEIRRANAKLAVLPENPPDAAQKRGLVVGSVAGNSKTAQSKQQSDKLIATYNSGKSGVGTSTGKTVLVPGVTSIPPGDRQPGVDYGNLFKNKALASDPLRSGGVGSTAVNGLTPTGGLSPFPSWSTPF